MVDGQQPMTADQGATSVMGMLFGNEASAAAVPKEDPVDPAAEAAPEEADFFEFPSEKEGEAARRVPVEEVLSGYRERDTLKAELDKTRQDMVARQILPADVEAVMADNLSRAQALQQAIDLWQSSFVPPPPDQSLLDRNSVNYDPDAFAEQLNAYQNGRQMLAKAQKTRNAAQQQVAKDQEALTASRHVKEQQALVSKWPEIVDQAVQKQVIDYATGLGFAPQEIAQTTDHRAWLVLRDAMAFRALNASKEAAVKAVTAKPRLVRGGAATSSPDRNPANGQFQSAVARLSNGGTALDGADAYMAALNRK
jgi:hypothetical protein